MHLQQLQHLMQALHDVQLNCDIQAFMLQPRQRQAMPGAKLHLPEQIFLCETAENFEVSLFIEPTVLQQLQHDSPLQRLHSGNLAAFCIAVEGVSHFVMLAWRQGVGRPTTALEMELQAEVDKFVLAMLLLQAQCAQALARKSAKLLHRQLFQAYVLHQTLPAHEVTRYTTASRAAQRVCQGWLDNSARLVPAARRFLRLPLSEKLRL